MLPDTCLEIRASNRWRLARDSRGCAGTVGTGRGWGDGVTGSPPGLPRSDQLQQPPPKVPRGSRGNRKDAGLLLGARSGEEPAEHRGEHGSRSRAKPGSSPHFITYKFSDLVSQLPNDEMVFTTAACINEGGPTVLTNNPPNPSGWSTHLPSSVQRRGGTESSAPCSHSTSQALLFRLSQGSGTL